MEVPPEMEARFQAHLKSPFQDTVEKLFDSEAVFQALEPKPTEDIFDKFGDFATVHKPWLEWSPRSAPEPVLEANVKDWIDRKLLDSFNLSETELAFNDGSTASYFQNLVTGLSSIAVEISESEVLVAASQESEELESSDLSESEPESATSSSSVPASCENSSQETRRSPRRKRQKTLKTSGFRHEPRSLVDFTTKSMAANMPETVSGSASGSATQMDQLEALRQDPGLGHSLHAQNVETTKSLDVSGLSDESGPNDLAPDHPSAAATNEASGGGQLDEEQQNFFDSHEISLHLKEADDKVLKWSRFLLDKSSPTHRGRPAVKPSKAADKQPKFGSEERPSGRRLGDVERIQDRAGGDASDFGLKSNNFERSDKIGSRLQEGFFSAGRGAGDSVEHRHRENLPQSHKSGKASIFSRFAIF